MADLRDAGALLQRAGLAMPVADAATFTTSYADVYALMRELRAMGEANPLTARHRAFSTRDLFAEAARTYAETYPAEHGRVAATFDIIFLAGWAPAPHQPQPLRPGSVSPSLDEALSAARSSKEDT